MKKKIGFLFTILLAVPSLLIGCDSIPNNPSNQSNANNKDEIREIYNLYLGSGGTMTYDQWLESIKGEQGAPGKDGTSLLTGSGSPNQQLGNDGDSYIDLSTWNFYTKADGSWTKQGNIKGQEDDNEQGLDFYLQDDGTYAVSTGRSTYLSEIVIPSTYRGKEVTRVMREFGFNGFSVSRFTSITIPNTIKEIEYSAFQTDRSQDLTINYLGTLEDFNQIKLAYRWLGRSPKGESYEDCICGETYFVFSDQRFSLTEALDQIYPIDGENFMLDPVLRIIKGNSFYLSGCWLGSTRIKGIALDIYGVSAESEDTNVITISEGRLKALQVGETYVVLTYKNIRYRLKVIVIEAQ